ncbi:CU044_5270 family protein [Actinoallomurus rhizosphaericola]|uniref:CU044_5270 family protein n=1 Tax=Actinoallomurus rhizosphaericola TaxID=2952536 RepID=UPI00209353E6|nr:CU044_5270 family protein [Actinoallomurus rhizosphaericola]MCO5996024.1 CU044_5270 family protein [Actinoallomurus rhizosphaericola]
MDELDALRRMRTTLAREENPDRLALRTNWRSAPAPRPRARRRLAVPLMGVVAAGTVAAGSVAVLSGHSDPRPPGRSVPLRTGGDGNVLLTAATSAEKAAQTGAYWHTRRIDGTIYGVGKTRADHYMVESRQQYDSWVGRDGRETRNYTDLPARPWTAQDAAKWRKAGSPMTVDVPSGDPGVVGTLFLNPKSPVGAPHPRPVKGQVRRFYGMTSAQIAELPTEPKALEKRLLALRGNWHAYSSTAVTERLGALRGEERVRALSDVAGDLLADAPTPPKVRAAAFRMLATLPGVRAGGTAADPLGRTGTVISLPLETTVPLGIYTAPKQLGTYRRQWIIDPGTGTLLAVRDLVATPPHGSRRLPPGDDGRPRTLRVQDMPDRFHRPGEVSSYTVYAVTEWTNAKPGTPTPR